ncbi:MAG: hypothetical protein ABI760_09890 [Ferruginibacter sp.]
MNFKRVYNKVCCVMQWNIGLSRGNIEQIIREKNCHLSFKWFPLNDPARSIADPFLFKDTAGNLNLIYEDFSMIDPASYGKIVLATLDPEFTLTGNKKMLDTKSHTSYPFVFVENSKTYIIPETGSKNKVSAFEYDFKNKCLINERVIINNLPLLDSTIFKHGDKYWLFATLSVPGFAHSALHIYYADSLFGKYQPHPNNPVKNNLNGSRPAGNIIKVDGEIYRPAQNCGQHYGESLSINRVTKLSVVEFAEEFYFKIQPDKTSEFNSGVHTLNVLDDIIVIDGIKMLFKPLTKWKLFFIKKFRK